MAASSGVYRKAITEPKLAASENLGKVPHSKADG